MSDIDETLDSVHQSYRSDREDYVRGLLAEHRESLAAAEATEATYRAVQAEYASTAGPGQLDRIIAKQQADVDARTTRAVGDGAYHHRRAQVYALAYLVERDVDDRKERR